MEIEMLIFELPGAIIRWLLGKILMSKKTFKSYLKEDSFPNILVGIVFYLVLFIYYLSRN